MYNGGQTNVAVLLEHKSWLILELSPIAAVHTKNDFFNGKSQMYGKYYTRFATCILLISNRVFQQQLIWGGDYYHELISTTRLHL